MDTNTLRETIDTKTEGIRKRKRWMQDGTLDTQSGENAFYGIAIRKETIARCYAFLGEVTKAREEFREAAGYYLKDIETTYQYWEEIRHGDRVNIPAVLTRAIGRAVLSLDQEAIESTAEETLALSDAFLDDYDDDHALPYRLYIGQLIAAVAIDGTRQDPLLSRVIDIADTLDTEYNRTVADLCKGIVTDETTLVETGLEKMVSLHAQTVDQNTDSVNEYFAGRVAQFCIMARLRGHDVIVNTEYVPPELVDVPVGNLRDQLNLQPTTGYFGEVEETDEGEYTITERVFHPGGRRIRADDLPMTSFGRILTDDWLTGTIEAMRTSDHEDVRQRGTDLSTALDRDELSTHLLVEQPVQDEFMFDESFRELDVDKVDFRKGL